MRIAREALAVTLALGLAGTSAAQTATSAAQTAPQQASPFTRAVQAETIDAPWVETAAGLDMLLPRRVDSIYKVLSERFQPARAMEIVNFMDRYWRLAANPGFLASLDRIKAGLLDAGFSEGKGPGAGLWFDEYQNGGNGWEPVRADVTIVSSAAGANPERVFDPLVDYIALCINSFSTPAGGLTAPLVYVGAGTDPADYASVDVKGAVVLGDGTMRALWQEAVRARGAIGVISAASPAEYTRPDQSPEVFQWGSVPLDEALRAFGFKASPAVARRLKERLRAGPVTVKVDVETRFHPGPGRTLVAEIRGKVRPDERVVLVAHVQEPGSNDNASGCGTLLEVARSLQAAIAAKAIPAPARTITFIWGDEMRASREWLRADPARAAATRYMFSLDMVGEDTRKTGGTFLIEKEPDPSAVWPRPSDPHTEWWGGGNYKADALKGSLMNDLYLAVCLRRARETGWVVQTSPYEGGSDHSIFLGAAIPAVLATHFTDRYYHTNLDRPDKTSPAVMGHVGVTVATTVALLSSATEEDAMAVAALVADAGRRRLELARRESAGVLRSATDRVTAEEGERVYLDSWTRWYTRALEGVLALPAAGPGGALEGRVKRAIRELTQTR